MKTVAEFFNMFEPTRKVVDAYTGYNVDIHEVMPFDRVTFPKLLATASEVQVHYTPEELKFVKVF